MNILLTSVGRRTYIVEYFKEALKGNGSIHVSNSVYTIAMEAADSFFITPLIYDKKYIPALLNYCAGNEIKAVLSLFDLDLPILAKNRDLFARQGTKVILAPEESVTLCNDKWKTFLFLKENKIATPRTYLTPENALKDVRNGEVSFPLIIKPRWGMASIGIYCADNEQELTVLYNKSKKEIFSSYLQYESQQAPSDAVLIQQKLNGQEHGLDVVNDLDGHYVRTFAKKKIAMRAGETDIGETVNSARFEEIARVLSRKIRHEGILSVDCFVDDEGISVTELNCRISGHYPLSHLAGVNVPKQIVEWLQHKPTNESLLQFKEGLVIAKDLVPRIMK
jgi:carbamoyl-phosphate synthase large subunit